MDDIKYDKDAMFNFHTIKYPLIKSIVFTYCQKTASERIIKEPRRYLLMGRIFVLFIWTITRLISQMAFLRAVLTCDNLLNLLISWSGDPAHIFLFDNKKQCATVFQP